MCAVSPRHLESTRFLVRLKAISPHNRCNMSQAEENCLKHLELPHGLSKVQTSWTSVESLQLPPRPRTDNLGKARFYEVGWEVNVKFSNISLNVILLCDNFWILQPISTKNSKNTTAIISLNSADSERNWNKRSGKIKENGQKWQRGSLQARMKVHKNHPREAEQRWRSVSITFFNDTHQNKNTIRMMRHRQQEHSQR